MLLLVGVFKRSFILIEIIKIIKMAIFYACWAGLGLGRSAAHVYKLPWHVTQSRAPDGAPSTSHKAETAAGRRRHRPTIPPPPRATSPRPPLYVARLLPPLTARPPAHPPAPPPPPPPPLLLRRLRSRARNASTRRRTLLTPPLLSPQFDKPSKP